MQGVYAMYRLRLARAGWEKGDRCIARFGESLFGRTPAIGTCPGSHWAFRWCTTDLRSPCNRFSVEQDTIDVWGQHHRDIVSLYDYMSRSMEAIWP